MRVARLLAVALCFANPLLHKPLSDLFDALFARLGRTWYERLVLAGIGALCAAGVALGRAYVRAPARARGIISLAALAAMTLVAQRWLLVSNIELIHFPQFALLTFLLLAGGLTPQTAWALATAAGMLDETYQRLVIYARVPNTYLDFNDMLLNAIGAAWAVALWAGEECTMATSPAGGRRAWGAAAAAAVLGTALVWLDPPQLPLLRKAATGRPYRVLSAPEAAAWAATVWGLIRWRLRGNTQPALSVTRKAGLSLRSIGIKDRGPERRKGAEPGW